MPVFTIHTREFEEFNRCHNPEGPGGGRFCSDKDAFVAAPTLQTRVPRNYSDAAEIMALGWFEEKERQDVTDPTLKGNVYWQNRLRQERLRDLEGAVKNWSKVLKQQDPAKVRPEVVAAVEQGMADNAANLKFMRVVGRYGSDGVIAVPGIDDPSAHWDSSAAARRVGRVTVVMDTFWFEAKSMAQRDAPRPGQATIESSSGMAGILRHEYAHYAWNRMRIEDHISFREAILPFRGDEPASRGGGNTYPGLEKRMTLYSATNAEEAFTESFAVWSDPKFDRTRFPPEVHPIFDWYDRRFGGRVIEHR